MDIPAIVSLGLVSKSDSIILNDYASNVHATFPNLYKGLGNLEEEYKIELKPDAAPFALYTPRIIPLPLRDKVQKELRQMEELGVISKIDKPKRIIE